MEDWTGQYTNRVLECGKAKIRLIKSMTYNLYYLYGAAKAQDVNKHEVYTHDCQPNEISSHRENHLQ